MRPRRGLDSASQVSVAGRTSADVRHSTGTLLKSRPTDHKSYSSDGEVGCTAGKVVNPSGACGY